MAFSLLLIESDFETRLTISAALAHEGYSVDTLSSPVAALSRLVDHVPDLIITDLGFDAATGLDHVRSIRDLTDAPMILLSDSDDLATSLASLEIADDFVKKGAPFEILLARIKAVLRRTATFQPPGPRQEAPGGAIPRAEPARTPARRPGSRGRPSKYESHLTAKYRFRPRDYSVEPGTAVLVADSDARDRARTARFLARAGYQVIEADSGLQALTTVARYKPKLIITEITLKNTDGLTVIRTVKSHPVAGPTKIMVLSHVGKPEVQGEAMDLGVADYIVKPCLPEELWLRVQWVMSGDTPQHPGPDSEAALQSAAK